MNSNINNDQTISLVPEEQKAKQSKSRRVFLRRSLMGAAVIAPVGALAVYGATGNQLFQSDSAHAARYNDPLEAVFKNAEVKRVFREIKDDENDHVAFLQKALKAAGVTPRPKPTFKNLLQANRKDFLKLAATFENVGVGAYLLAVPAIQAKPTLAAAASILTIEARHAGFLDFLLQKPLSPNGAFDKPIPQATIVADVAGFIKSLNGGANPANKLANDADILNFALLLEFLEAEFYNLNVPKFFK